MKTTIAHLCPEWDYAHIDPTDPEWDACLCEEGEECLDLSFAQLHYLQLIKKSKDSMENTEEYIQKLFTYHTANDVELRRFEEIREAAKELGRAIYRNKGDRYEDAEMAVQKLRECVYFAIASIVVPS